MKALTSDDLRNRGNKISDIQYQNWHIQNQIPFFKVKDKMWNIISFHIHAQIWKSTYEKYCELNKK
jgi:hypothetical protein